VNTEFTPYRRVMTALHGDKPDKTPFTIYQEKIPRCTAERDLRNRGLCLVKRTTSYSMYRPNVEVKSCHYTDKRGRNVVRTVYSTPVGEVSTLTQPAGFTTWTHERMFKSPDDYKVLQFIIEDTVVRPNYEAAARIVDCLGEDYVVRDNLPLEPLQALISSSYMSMEDFCIQWMDHRDEILKLYEGLVKVARQIYPIVARGPLEFANYGGNVTPQIIGSEVFREYYVPHYNEAAAILHEHGKLIGCHLDADNTLIMDVVAETDLDYIEAYDPGISPPVRDARKAWPDKVLWLNWPSALQLRPLHEVEAKTVEMIKEAAPGNGFIIGITEDVPENRILENMRAIMNGIDKCACNIF